MQQESAVAAIWIRPWGRHDGLEGAVLPTAWPLGTADSWPPRRNTLLTVRGSVAFSVEAAARGKRKQSRAKQSKAGLVGAGADEVREENG